MPGDIQIAFPRQETGTALVVPTTVDSAANAGLATYAAAPIEQTRRTLSCKELLGADTLKDAQAEAAQLLDEMLSNSTVFMAYGTKALEGVNALINRLLHDVKPTEIPELNQLMQELNSSMRGVKKKYDPADPKVREKYEHWKGGIWRFIGNAKSLVDLLMEDVTSIETQLGKVEKDLKGRQYDLVHNVAYYDELYTENEQEIEKLIFAIGVMELIRDLAAQRAAAIKPGDANLGDREGEKKAEVAQFASNMEIKIAEYKGRLMIAWATAPQVRNMRTLDVGLAERINELVNVTVPTMKATIVQWRLLLQAKDAAEISKTVQDASNQWLQDYARSAELAVPMIAEAVQTPTLTPQTISAMAESISHQADGMIHALQVGDEKRKEMDEAIMDAGKVIADSTARLSDAQINRIVNTATKPLEITTTVPEAAAAN